MSATKQEQIATAKKILEHKTCINICECHKCPIWNLQDHASCDDVKGGDFADGKNVDKALQWFRDWLSENDKEEEVKSYVDWDKIPKEYNYVAVQPDQDHSIFMFPLEPEYNKSGWWSNREEARITAEFVPATALAYAKKDIPSPTHSLIKRPDEVQKEIIGWPGNVEEMRQYIGRNCILCDDINFENHSDEGAFEIGWDDKEMPYSNTICGYFRYCKLLPEKAFYVFSRQEIAEKFGVPVYLLRIKD